MPSNINPSLAPFGAVEMGRLRDNDAVIMEKDDPAGALMARSDEELVILDVGESAMQSTGALGHCLWLFQVWIRLMLRVPQEQCRVQGPWMHCL